MNTVMHIPSRASRERILHYCVGICFAPNVMHDIAWSRTDVLCGLSTDRAPLGDDSRSLPLWGVLFWEAYNIAAIRATFLVESHCPSIVDLVHKRPLVEYSWIALSYFLVTAIRDSPPASFEIP